MAKINDGFQVLMPLLEMVRDAEMQKLAVTNQKIETLEQEIRSLREHVCLGAPCDSENLGADFHVRNIWRKWGEKRGQELSSELMNLAADREIQKAKLAVALGRADVVADLANRKAKSPGTY